MADKYTGERRFALEAKTFTSGGNAVIEWGGVPAGYRVKYLLFRLELAIVQGASASAVVGAKLARAFASIRIGRRINVTGQYLRALGTMMMGRSFDAPAGVPAAAATYRRVVQVVLPFVDLKSAHPSDCAVPIDLLRNDPILFDFAALTSVYSADTTASGTLRTIAVCEPMAPGVVPTPVLMGFEDWTQQTIKLGIRDASLGHLFLFNEDGTGITNAELDYATLKVDGETIIDRLEAEELVSLYNWHKAAGVSVYTASDTAPVGSEALTDEPGVAGGAAATITPEFCPLFVPEDGYLITKLPWVGNDVRLDLSGSDTSMRVGYRAFEAISGDAAEKAARKIGVVAPSVERATTKALKGAVNIARHAKLLPKRFHAEG